MVLLLLPQGGSEQAELDAEQAVEETVPTVA
jgi:hypothetical protein